jgi:hypothetical protein
LNDVNFRTKQLIINQLYFYTTTTLGYFYRPNWWHSAQNKALEEARIDKGDKLSRKEVQCPLS